MESAGGGDGVECSSGGGVAGELGGDGPVGDGGKGTEATAPPSPVIWSLDGGTVELGLQAASRSMSKARKGRAERTPGRPTVLPVRLMAPLRRPVLPFQ